MVVGSYEVDVAWIDLVVVGVVVYDDFFIIMVSIILGWFCIISSRPTSIGSKGLGNLVLLGISKMRCGFGDDSSSPRWTLPIPNSTVSRLSVKLAGGFISSTSIASSSYSSS